MANTEQITRTAAYNSLALTTLGHCPMWDVAAKRFLAANCLQQADLDYGAFSTANEQAAFERIRLEGLYGRNWREDPRARSAMRALVEADREADDAWTAKFTEPFWQAIRDLVVVPAPTIAAAVFKSDLIYAEEAWNDNRLQADCMRILSDDFVRLTDTNAERTDWDALLAAYKNAKAAVDHCNAQEAPANETGSVAHGLESERLAAAHAGALDAVLLAPAPDVRALSKKLQIFNMWQVEDGWHTAREIVEQLAADSRRLLGEA